MQKTAQLISAFDFATGTVIPLKSEISRFNPAFVYRPVYVRPGHVKAHIIQIRLMMISVIWIKMSSVNVPLNITSLQCYTVLTV